MNISIGGLPDFSDHAHERYMSHFGPLNQPLLLGNHTFVMVDAPGLVEEDARRVRSGLSFERWATTKPGGPIAFIQESAAVAKGHLRTVRVFVQFAHTQDRTNQSIAYYFIDAYTPGPPGRRVLRTSQGAGHHQEGRRLRLREHAQCPGLPAAAPESSTRSCLQVNTSASMHARR